MTEPIRHVRVCSNCWQRRAVPRFATCPECFYFPRQNRANATWAGLIAAVNEAADTTTNIRKAA